MITNINSVRSKFEQLCELVAGNVYIILIDETKLDSLFPISQLLSRWFSESF